MRKYLRLLGGKIKHAQRQTMFEMGQGALKRPTFDLVRSAILFDPLQPPLRLFEIGEDQFFLDALKGRQ